MIMICTTPVGMSWLTRTMMMTWLHRCRHSPLPPPQPLGVPSPPHHLSRQNLPPQVLLMPRRVRYSLFGFFIIISIFSPLQCSFCPAERVAQKEPSTFRNSMVRGKNRTTLTPEELRERTLSVLAPGNSVAMEPKIEHHSKKYEISLITTTDKSQRKYILDVSIQGLRIRTKEKEFVRFFDMEVLECVRLRVLPNGENIMEIDFVREYSSSRQDKFGRVIILTDQGKAIMKELNSYKPKRRKQMQK